MASLLISVVTESWSCCWSPEIFLANFSILTIEPLLGIIAETLSSTEIEKMFPADEIRLKNKFKKAGWQLSGKDGQAI